MAVVLVICSGLSIGVAVVTTVSKYLREVNKLSDKNKMVKYRLKA